MLGSILKITSTAVSVSVTGIVQLTTNRNLRLSASVVLPESLVSVSRPEIYGSQLCIV